MTRTEAILEARRMMAAGEFMRSVVGTTSTDLHFDTLALDCGHTVWQRPDETLPERVRCSECATEWISVNSGEPSEREQKQRWQEQRLQQLKDLQDQLRQLEEKGRDAKKGKTEQDAAWDALTEVLSKAMAGMPCSNRETAATKRARQSRQPASR